jgi:hypothetical protein
MTTASRRGKDQRLEQDQTLRMGSIGQCCITRRATTITTVATPAIAVRIQKTFIGRPPSLSFPCRPVTSQEDRPSRDVHVPTRKAFVHHPESVNEGEFILCA